MQIEKAPKCLWGRWRSESIVYLVAIRDGAVQTNRPAIATSIRQRATKLACSAGLSMQDGKGTATKEQGIGFYPPWN